MNHTDEEILIDICRQVGVGFRAVQGATRSADVVACRRVVVITLRKQCGWTMSRIARAVQKDERSVRRMLKQDPALRKRDRYAGVLRAAAKEK